MQLFIIVLLSLLGNTHIFAKSYSYKMKKRPSLNSAFIKLQQLVTLDKKDLSTVYFFAILGGIISLTLPLGIQTILTFVMAATFSTSIAILILLVLIGVFLNGLVQVRQMQAIERIRQKIFTRYSLEMSHKIPNLDLEKLDNYYLPQMVNYFFDVTSLTKSMEKILLDIPAAIFQIFLGLLLLSFYHPIFIAFGLAVVAVLFIILKYTSRRGFETNMEASDYKYKIAGWLQEVAHLVKSFKYSRDNEIHMTRSNSLVSGYLVSRTNHFKVLVFQYWSFISFKILIVASMLLVGSYLLIEQQINLGQFIASDIVIILIISSVEKLITGVDKVYDSLTSIEKLSKVIDSENEEGGSVLLQTAKGVAVDFSNVNYTYPDGSKALENVNLKIKPGKIIGITAPSGSGRSTLIRLLTGAFKGYTGMISINEIPVSNYDVQNLRKHSGILLSQQDIFNGTILENITMGNTNISMQEITSLATKTGFTGFVNSNKKGFDLLLDPFGKKLNNHIRRNILLMRALTGKPALLLLEEPFEHLPIEQQTTMMDYLKNDSNATAIILTNNEYILNRCSSIVKMNTNQTITQVVENE